MAFDLSSARDIEEPKKGKFDLASATEIAQLGGVKAEEPDWFMPGSKSEAAVRGVANAATFGLGNKIQAYLRAASDDTGGKKSYLERARALEDEERAANASAAETNPGSYLAGNIVGGIPQGIGLARNALLAQGARTGLSGLGAAAVGAGAKGAQYGAVQGAGSSASDFSDVLPKTVEGAGLGGATAAVAIPVAQGVGKLLPKAIDKTAQVLRSQPKPVVDGATAATTSILPNVSLPAIGALGGMGYRNVQTDNPVNWREDPYSAMGETAMAGAKGAALGLGAKYGVMAGEVVADKAMSGIATGLNTTAKWGQAAMNAANKATDELVTTGQTGPKLIAGRGNPFAGLMERVNKPKGPAAPEGMDPKQAQKQAMSDTATPEGRAKTNTDSPYADETEDEFMQRMQGR